MGSHDKIDKNKNKDTEKITHVVTADVHRDKDGNQGRKEDSASGQE